MKMRKALGALGLSTVLAMGMSMPAFAAPVNGTTTSGDSPVTIAMTSDTPQIDVEMPGPIAFSFMGIQAGTEYFHNRVGAESLPQLGSKTVFPTNVKIKNNNPDHNIKLVSTEIVGHGNNSAFSKWVPTSAPYYATGKAITPTDGFFNFSFKVTGDVKTDPAFENKVNIGTMFVVGPQSDYGVEGEKEITSKLDASNVVLDFELKNASLLNSSTPIQPYDIRWTVSLV